MEELSLENAIAFWCKIAREILEAKEEKFRKKLTEQVKEDHHAAKEKYDRAQSSTVNTDEGEIEE